MKRKTLDKIEKSLTCYQWPKAKDVFHKGDVVEVVIQKVDIEKRKIYASYRLAVENPWETFLHHFPIGTRTTAEVVSIKDFGVFAKLSNGCTGLLHHSNYPAQMPAISPGDSLEVVIDNFDQKEQHIAFRCPSA
jgi:small subunit ribosomal protein S1